MEAVFGYTELFNGQAAPQRIGCAVFTSALNLHRYDHHIIPTKLLLKIIAFLRELIFTRNGIPYACFYFPSGT